MELRQCISSVPTLQQAQPPCRPPIHTHPHTHTQTTHPQRTRPNPPLDQLPTPHNPTAPHPKSETSTTSTYRIKSCVVARHCLCGLMVKTPPSDTSCILTDQDPGGNVGSIPAMGMLAAQWFLHGVLQHSRNIQTQQQIALACALPVLCIPNKRRGRVCASHKKRKRNKVTAVSAKNPNQQLRYSLAR